MDPELEALIAQAKAAGATPAEMEAFLRANGYGPGGGTTPPGTPPSGDRSFLTRFGHALVSLPGSIPKIPGQIAGDLLNAFQPVQGEPRVPTSAARFGKVPDPTPRTGTEGIDPAVARHARLNTLANAVLPILPGGIPTLTATGAALGAINAPSGERDVGAVLGGLFGGAGGLFGRRGMPTRETPMTRRLADARANGIDLTLGQATGSTLLKKGETATAVLPTGAGRMSQFAHRQAEAFGTRAEHLAEQIAGGPVPSREAAGASVIHAADRVLQEFDASVPVLQSRAAQALDAAFPSATGTTTPTNAELLRLNPNDPALRASLRAHTQAGGTLPSWAALPSAPPSSTGIPLPQLRSLVEEWRTQAGKKSVPEGLPAALQQAEDLLASAEAGELSASNLMTHRAQFNARAYAKGGGYDAQKSFAKRLTNTLSHDLAAAADAAGPEAQAAWRDYNLTIRGFRSTSQVDNPAGAAFWERVAKATPDEAFNLVTNHPNNAARVQAIRARLTPEEFNPAAGRHFLDLGIANPSAQSTTELLSNPETFTTRWNNRKFSPEVKAAMYGGGADALPEAFPSFLRTVDELASMKAHRNPSGTAGMLQGTQLLRDVGNVIASPVTKGVQWGVAPTAATAAVTGHPLAAVGGLGLSMGVPYVGARIATSPLALRGLERMTAAPRLSLMDALRNLTPPR